jgi:hypothetical protein
MRSLAATMKVVRWSLKLQSYQFELGLWRTLQLCFTALAEFEAMAVTATTIVTVIVVSSDYLRI